MPSQTFKLDGDDAKYLQGRKSMKFVAEDVANGVQSGCPGICLTPFLPPANGCRTKWNPKPQLIYKVDQLINGNVEWPVVAAWGSLPTIPEHDIAADTSGLTVATELPLTGKMSWSPPSSTTSGAFAYDPPTSLELVGSSPTCFLSYTGAPLSPGVDDPVTNCRDIFTNTVDVFRNVERANVPTMPAPATVPYFNINEAHYSVSVDGRSALRWFTERTVSVTFREHYVVTIDNVWDDGAMGMRWTVVLNKTIISETKVRATIVWVSSGPNVYELRFELVDYEYDYISTFPSGPLVGAHLNEGSSFDETVEAGCTGGRTAAEYKAFPDYYSVVMNERPSSILIESSPVSISTFVTHPTSVTSTWKL